MIYTVAKDLKQGHTIVFKCNNGQQVYNKPPGWSNPNHSRQGGSPKKLQLDPLINLLISKWVSISKNCLTLWYPENCK